MNSINEKKPISYSSQEIILEDEFCNNEMDYKKMKKLLDTKDDLFIEDTLNYWKLLENIDAPEFSKAKLALWLKD